MSWDTSIYCAVAALRHMPLLSESVHGDDQLSLLLFLIFTTDAAITVWCGGLWTGRSR